MILGSTLDAPYGTVLFVLKWIGCVVAFAVRRAGCSYPSAGASRLAAPARQAVSPHERQSGIRLGRVAPAVPPGPDILFARDSTLSRRRGQVQFGAAVAQGQASTVNDAVEELGSRFAYRGLRRLR